jgi:hypothetical protein
MRQDLCGQRFGKLVVMEYVGKAQYFCVCDCGGSSKAFANNLRAGRTKSCGCLQGSYGLLPANFKDLTGTTFGRLLVISRAENDESGNSRWNCKCSCGAMTVVLALDLRNSTTKSCGCLQRDGFVAQHAALDSVLIGRKFSRLTVLRRVNDDEFTHDHKHLHYLCKCSCGKSCIVAGYNLQSGNSSSCGCFAISQSVQRFTTHGHSKKGRWTRTYRSWSNMCDRCTNPRNRFWKDYGGAGITVCDRWSIAKGGSYENFFSDMGERPEATSIGRYADLSNYAPGECCWMTRAEQGLARRNKYALLKWAARQPQEHQAQIAA